MPNGRGAVKLGSSTLGLVNVSVPRANGKLFDYLKQQSLGEVPMLTESEEQKLLASASPYLVAGPERPVVKLGVTGEANPAEADFNSFKSLIAPRGIDVMLMFSNYESADAYASSWPTWATNAGATLMLTITPSAETLGALTAGTKDTVGLFNNEGLKRLATKLKTSGLNPMYVRVCHEFNIKSSVAGTSYGYGAETAKQFVEGWQHLKHYCDVQGVNNVKWVWCANIWGEGSANLIDPTVPDGSGVNWYPGDAYVDMIALDGYQKLQSVKLETPEELFLKNYEALCKLTTKPFGITEVGCTSDPRMGPNASVKSKADWYEKLFELVANKMPRCELVTNWQRAKEEIPPSTGKFEEDKIDTDPSSKAAFAAAILKQPFTSWAGT